MSLSAQAEAQRHAKVRVSQQYIFITGDHGVVGVVECFSFGGIGFRGNGRAEEKKPAIEEADSSYNNNIFCYYILHITII